MSNTLLGQSEQQAMATRLLATLDLMEFGIALMRQNIVRKLPGATPEEINAEMRRWLIEQPEHFEVLAAGSSEQR